jgi:UDP:flavonoid glycosyltransferase YjiC (YdhE family)
MHGGHNTVGEALAHGLPLVVAPIRDDQPVIARQAADAGVGVRFEHVQAAELRDAVRAVLGDPRYAAAAVASGTPSPPPVAPRPPPIA